VVAAGAMVVAEDAAEDPRFADDPLLRERGVRFYAGAPLRAPGGLTLGALCVTDTEPRTFAAPERERLQALADEVAAEIGRRLPSRPAGAEEAAA
jgi:GAF domain-containing protein